MEAIIIKKALLKEYDELVFIYSKEEGKAAYVAKGVSRHTSKQASHLDLFNMIDFSAVKGKSYPIIASAHCLNSYTSLKSNLQAMAVGHFLLEVFDKAVLENQADEKLWNLLRGWLEKLNDLGKSNSIVWPSILRSLQAEISENMGYDSKWQLENLTNRPLDSLQFLRKVIKS